MKNITLTALLFSSLFCLTAQAMNQKRAAILKRFNEKQAAFLKNLESSNSDSDKDEVINEERGIIIPSSHIKYESNKVVTGKEAEKIADDSKKALAELALLGTNKPEEKILLADYFELPTFYTLNEMDISGAQTKGISYRMILNPRTNKLIPYSGNHPPKRSSTLQPVIKEREKSLKDIDKKLCKMRREIILERLKKNQKTFLKNFPNESEGPEPDEQTLKEVLN